MPFIFNALANENSSMQKKINDHRELEAHSMHGDLYIWNNKFSLDALCTWTEGVLILAQNCIKVKTLILGRRE